MKGPRGWSVRVEGWSLKPVEPGRWMHGIEPYGSVMTFTEEPDEFGRWAAAYTVNIAVRRAGRAVDIAIGLARPMDPKFEVRTLEAKTFEELDRED